MNIFILDYNTKKTAEYHCDKHVVKMIVESAQLLCTAHHSTGVSNDLLYKATHINHPCNVWVRNSASNYKWLSELSLYLLEEYKFRYDKEHRSSDILRWCNKHIPSIPDKGLTQFALAMPDDCKIGQDAVLSYRYYYVKYKNHLLSWKRRDVPLWVKQLNYGKEIK